MVLVSIPLRKKTKARTTGKCHSSWDCVQRCVWMDMDVDDSGRVYSFGSVLELESNGSGR